MQPRVEGDALVFNLLNRVPAPKGQRFGIGAGIGSGIGQQVVGQHRCEVFKGDGGGQIEYGRAFAGQREQIGHALVDARQVIAGLHRQAVEGNVLPAVVHFLGNEGADGIRQRGGRTLAMVLDRLDKKRFATGERGRQRRVPGRGHRIAAQPPARGRRTSAKPPVAHTNDQIGWSRLARERLSGGTRSVRWHRWKRHSEKGVYAPAAASLGGAGA